MQVRKLLSAATVIAAILVGYPLGSKENRANDVRLRQGTSVDKWVQDNYPIVLGKLMPDGELSPNEFPRNVKWVATVRILPPYQQPEYSFSMQKMYDGKIEVSLINAKGVSIRSQLQDIKSKYPDASLERMAAFVSIYRRTITQSEKSQLGKLAAKLEAIKMSPVLPDELRVDDTSYEFWSQSLWGNRMKVILRGPGAQAKIQPHPLLQWAETVRSFMDRSAR